MVEKMLSQNWLWAFGLIHIGICIYVKLLLSNFRADIRVGVGNGLESLNVKGKYLD